MMRTPGLILALLFSSSLLAAGHDLTTSPPAANQLQAVVTGNGSGFTAAWYEPALSRYRAVSSVVNANGEPIEGGVASIDQPPVSSTAIAHSPSETLVVWTADDKVIAERLSPSGTSLSTFLVTFGNGYVSDVAVAWNGERYLVVWSNKDVQLLGAFVAPDGSSTTPRLVFGEPFSNGQGPEEFVVGPEIAWDGQHFIVVFAELPNSICSTLCPIPNPNRFRVMRVSADGDALDSSPLVITGDHFRAHVASSGAESLIALESRGEVSTIVAHDDARGLTLDAETPLFRWFSDIVSDVAWDGAAFTVGWHYRSSDTSWIGAAHVTRSGLPYDYRVVGAFPYAFWGGPSIAVDDAGATAFVISEAATSSSIARARLYLGSELAPMPPPPPAPRNVVSYFGGTTARIDWQGETDGGFLIEWSWDFGKNWAFVKTVPGNTRTTDVYASVGNQFRVRAFGPGGISEGTITSIGSMQRRRAERH